MNRLLDDDEQRALDAVNAAHGAILHLGLRANTHELTAAVHVMQGFVIQRALGRRFPDEFSGRWFQGEGGVTG